VPFGAIVRKRLDYVVSETAHQWGYMPISNQKIRGKVRRVWVVTVGLAWCQRPKQTPASPACVCGQSLYLCVVFATYGAGVIQWVRSGKRKMGNGKRVL
jgi:hypothetical protein